MDPRMIQMLQAQALMGGGPGASADPAMDVQGAEKQRAYIQWLTEQLQAAQAAQQGRRDQAAGGPAGSFKFMTPGGGY